MSSKRKIKEGQLVGYDFTFPCDKFKKDDIVAMLNEWGKKWVFQKEKGDTGYIHWQGRIHLIKKRRKTELLSMGFGIGGHISPTTSGVHKGQTFNYVMKADTRMEGPFKNTDPVKPPLTRQLRTFYQHEFYPWQKKLGTMVQEFDDRRIIIILCPHGCNGKSIFAEHLEYIGQAYEIPCMRQMEDIMQCVCCVGKQKCFLVDMPRGIKKTRLGDFYAGMECLKNGTAYDKRYSFKKIRFDRPQIVVFTNNLPKFDLMSPDRWVVFQITKEKDLEKMSLPALASSL